MDKRPPRWALQFFRWYCHQNFVEDIEGDLLEKFEKRIEAKGVKYARQKFCLDIILLFRPGIIRSLFKGQHFNQYGMYKNYFKVGLRQMLKHKFYSTLNIAGLALGLSVALLIGLYLFDELTFDKFHKDYQNIYQVGLHVNFGGQEFRGPTTSVPLAKAMIENIPGVEQVTRLKTERSIVVRHENKAFIEANTFLADSNFFEFFSFKLLEGDVKTALKEPHTLVLTPKTAFKYFGNQSVLGKMLIVNNESFTVTGLVEEAPNNSQIHYDVLLSSESSEYMQRDWGNSGIYTYYRKNTKTPLASIESKLKGIMLKHIAPGMEEDLGMTFGEIEQKGEVIEFFSYAFTKSHLYYPEIEAGTAPTSDIKYVYMIEVLGAFILLIACINFMNLSTARSANRAREVGLRKTFGSVRTKLILQFLSESLIYVLIATAIAVITCYLLLPGFNLLSGKAISFVTILSPFMLGGVILTLFIVVLLAGTYPAFYLTSFNPVTTLKGNLRSSGKGKGIRSALVVIQFVTSISLVICTLTVFQQLNYMQHKNTGLDKQNVLILQNASRLGNNQNAFLEEVNKQPGIVMASYSNNSFPGVNNTGVYHTTGASKDILLPDYYADYNHLDVLKIPLIQGRYFSADIPSDVDACVINETTAKELGWTNPLNEKLLTINNLEKPVIGVVKDFNFESFKFKVKPLVINFRESSSYLLIRYRGSAENAVNSIEALWKQHAANEPFEYTFLDQNFDNLFREDQRLGKFFAVMTAIAIFVACLGLLGLAAFTAENRTKEIGIRKVLGASVASINTLLSKEFIILVGISFLMASSIARYTMNEWLSSFAYRIELGPNVFLYAGFLAITIAWLTVSYHFTRAARSNPVDALKYE